MTQDEQKKLVAREALRYVVDDAWVGVGTGSTITVPVISGCVLQTNAYVPAASNWQ